ncbi:uncharacterized protein FA14DRAFT_8173 [Meira miltonrushii]|uniref:Uncharacterized protein n=1 Tax=Meira miltonrushii TaxID=1280837 RepID=A0A316VLH4_9BASI|nr:uncharacterized protein FA14DRAFT_8173 [Meira miltonrushii]PWN36931.1 hypothetical protein FA14DRAFT_8173 [Meira miltonrushii]
MNHLEGVKLFLIPILQTLLPAQSTFSSIKMRFSNILVLVVAAGAATFANAAPAQNGVEVGGNVQFARDNLNVDHVPQARSINEPKNAVRGLNTDNVKRRGKVKAEEEALARRLIPPLFYLWAEFTDDDGNNGYGHDSLYSTDQFYVPDDKTKIRIHAFPKNTSQDFYIQNDQNEKQYIFSPYDGELINFSLNGTEFKFGRDDDDKKA